MRILPRAFCDPIARAAQHRRQRIPLRKLRRKAGDFSRRSPLKAIVNVRARRIVALGNICRAGY
jgi:hypothetical protein